MLELESLIIAEITKNIPEFLTIGNPSAITGIQDLGPLLPLCVVVPGEASPDLPKASDWTATVPLVDVQRWDVMTFIAHEHDELNHAQTELNASFFLNRLFAVLHGFQTKRVAKDAGMIYAGRDAPAYFNGWARFPMVFHARLALSDFTFCPPVFHQPYATAARTLGDDLRDLDNLPPP